MRTKLLVTIINITAEEISNMAAIWCWIYRQYGAEYIGNMVPSITSTIFGIIWASLDNILIIVIISYCHLLVKSVKSSTQSESRAQSVRIDIINHKLICFVFDGRLVQWSELQTTKSEVPGSNPGTGRGFCDEPLHLLTSYGCLYYPFI
jgi:hypothetical protein